LPENNGVGRKNITLYKYVFDTPQKDNVKIKITI
jgi:hypothetical protein